MSLGLQPPRPKKRQMRLRGGNGQAFLCTAHESCVSGPSQTGKTMAQCFKAHKACMDYPGIQALIVRKVYKAMRSTVLRTFAGVSVGCGVKAVGGETPNLFVYPNGSRLIPMGMDNPGDLLSGEYAFAYINQAEELEESAWELLASRCTGRGTTYPHPQVFGDCNPGGSKHWLRLRRDSGKLVMFESTHRDNPELYTSDGTITQEGKKQLDRLASSLSGVRYDRLWLGKWVTSEGAVYKNFNPRWHVCVREPGEMKQWYLALDWGFTNPAVVLLVGEDGDGRWHIFKEFYQTGQMREAVAKQAKQWCGEQAVSVAAVDGAEAEFIAVLKSLGVPAVGAKGIIDDTTPLVRDALEPVKGDTEDPRWPDGRPRLTLDPSCVETQNEFESYVFKPGTDTPIKKYDHAMDALRYLKIATGVPTGAFSAADLARASARPAGEEREERFVADRLGRDDF